MTINLAHVTASTFFGGPERQMLGLARALPADTYQSIFFSFSEGERCHSFLENCGNAGFVAEPLVHDTPHFRASILELTKKLRQHASRVVFCHGYKAGLLGRVAARRVGIPVIAVSRGWTYECLKVNAYELLDRINLRFMDHIVCVSEGQARKVRGCGVARRSVSVIPDSVNVERFHHTGLDARSRLLGFFETPPRWIVGAIGRLSPEKAFADFVRAAHLIGEAGDQIGFIIIGEGKTRYGLERLIADLGMQGRIVLAGFRNDIDQLLPALDVMVQSSHTEGMPNVVLEACAAGVPVVATRVGGTPEIILDGLTGRLVAPGEPESLASVIQAVLEDYSSHEALAIEGRARVEQCFTFTAQAEAYSRLIARVLQQSRPSDPSAPAGGSRHIVDVSSHAPAR